MDTHQDDCKALYPRPVPTKQTGTSWWMVALQFVLGGVGGFGVIAAIDALPGELTLPLLAGTLAVVLLMLWLQVLVHEAGHALAGLLAGRRFIAAGVGPLRLERGDGAWNLRWGGGVKGIGGFAATFPPGPERRRSAALFVLGGPVANLASAATAGAVLAVADVSHPLAMAALGSTALAGLLLGVVNLVPLQSHGWHSDGHSLRELLRDSPAWRVMQGQHLALAAAMAGIRPREWPAAPFDVPDELPLQARAPALSLGMSMALDRGELDTARDGARALAGIWPELPDGQRQGAAVMIATYAARAHDAELLAAWRPHCEGGLLDLSPYRLWLDAEAAAMAGDAEAARALVVQAREALPRVHDRSSVVVLGEYLDALEGRPVARHPRVGACGTQGVHGDGPSLVGPLPEDAAMTGHDQREQQETGSTPASEGPSDRSREESIDRDDASGPPNPPDAKAGFDREVGDIDDPADSDDGALPGRMGGGLAGG